MFSALPVSRAWTKIWNSCWNFADISFHFRGTVYFRFTVRHFEFRCWAMSAVTRAGQVWFKNWRYPLESRRYSIPFKSYFYFRSKVRHVQFRWSADVRQCRSHTDRLGVVENVGVAFGITSLSHSVQKLFLLPVQSPPFWIRVVGRCRAMSSWPRRGRKYGVAFEIALQISFQSKVISPSGFRPPFWKRKYATMKNEYGLRSHIDILLS
jgi:hypothetical protein